MKEPNNIPKNAMSATIILAINAKIKRFNISFLSVLFLSMLLITFKPIQAQVEENIPITLIHFSGVYNTGKIYLKWLVQCQEEDGIYLIERSFDGKKFKTIGFKKGIGIPLSIELLYCWIDTMPLQGTCYYQLKQIEKDGTLKSTKLITITTPTITNVFTSANEIKDKKKFINNKYE